MSRSVPWPKILWITCVLLLPGVIVYSFFPKIFECPACYLYVNNGDGLKNYFTLDYYVQHDSGWHFTGMNYPYGEHIIYTDNQPLLAMILRWVDRHIIDMHSHTVGTLNMLLLISIYLGVLISYLLLRRWHIGRWWALASALCIIFLSPQLLRLHGHYGLGYVFFFPLLFLLMDLLVRSQRKRWMWGLLAIFLIIGMSLTHLYFLFLSALVVVSFMLFYSLYHRKMRTGIRPVLLWLTGLAILPGLFLVLVREVTDPVTDRPQEPWGLDHFTVSATTTFIPFIPPLNKAWCEILEINTPENERNAYVGWVGLIMLPAILYFLFKRGNADPLTLHLKTFLGVGIVCWLMAAGFFYQYGFSFLWNSLPVLKQFRGLGRFGIPFYYLYGLVCCYLLWRFYLHMRDRELQGVAIYLLSAAFVIWGFQSWLHTRGVSRFILQDNTYLASSKTDYLPILTEAGYTPDDFQAILQLPLVAVGNESMGIDRGFWTMREGIHAAKETGIPLMGYAMSRTSVSQGLDLVEFISTPYFEKRRARKLNDKPILLLCEENNMLPAERKWIDQAIKLGNYNTVTLYKIRPVAFTTIQLPTLPDSLPFPPCGGWFTSFDQYTDPEAMTGTGAYKANSIEEPIWSYTDTAQVERQWVVSFWSRINHKKEFVPVPRMKETNPEGQILQNSGLHRDNIHWSEAYGSWLEVTFPLTTRGIGHSYELFLEQTGPVIDNLLIRPAADTCIMKFPDMILYNNLPIPLAE